MSNLHLAAWKGRSARARSRLTRRVLVDIIVLLLGAVAAEPAAAEKSFFFATREACDAAGLFDKYECVNAFVNASTELKARAPTFVNRTDCLLRFGLCESDPVDGRYTPVLLGVEIFETRLGGLATPVLAVASPQGMFRPHPIQGLEQTDPSRAPGEAEAAGGPLAPVLVLPSADGRRVEARNPSDFSRHPSETPAQRRERLLKAPFIE